MSATAPTARRPRAPRGSPTLNTQTTRHAAVQRSVLRRLRARRCRRQAPMFLAEFDTHEPGLMGLRQRRRSSTATRRAARSTTRDAARHARAGDPGHERGDLVRRSDHRVRILVQRNWPGRAAGPSVRVGLRVRLRSLDGARLDPWYRSWVDVEWRMALNGALYPTGSSIPAGPARVAGRRARRASRSPRRRCPRCQDRPVIKGDAARWTLGSSSTPARSARSKRPRPQGRRADVRDAARRSGSPRVTTASWSSARRGSPAKSSTPWLFQLGIVDEGQHLCA